VFHSAHVVDAVVAQATEGRVRRLRKAMRADHAHGGDTLVGEMQQVVAPTQNFGAAAAIGSVGDNVACEAGVWVQQGMSCRDRYKLGQC
jgi:hypothetical protein